MSRINRERLLDTFVKLVEIDSPSCGERAMCDELKKRLMALGLTVEEDDSAAASGSNCGNLIARLPGTLEIPAVLYSAHMDTVAPALGKKAIIHEDGQITSGGDTVLGADDVSGLAAILEAVQVIQENELPHGPLEIVFTTAEECYGKGADQVKLSKLSAKEAYIFDLTGKTGRAARRAPSIISFRIEAKGKSSHAGFAPEKGIHAISIAAVGVATVKLGCLSNGTTVNVGTIQGGSQTNIVPDSCVVTGEVRSYSHEKALQQVEEIFGNFRMAAVAFGGEINAEYEVCIRAYETDENSRVVKRFRKACEQMGVEPVLDETFGGSDLNVFAQKGIEGLVLASAMEHCHSCSEHTTVDELCQVGQMALTLMTAGE